MRIVAWDMRRATTSRRGAEDLDRDPVLERADGPAGDQTTAALGTLVGLILAPETLELIADRVGALLAARESTPASPWLDVSETAAYLRCSRQRIYDLVSAGRLRPAKDGSRSLFHRDWLDRYLLAERPTQVAA
jgi:excisionase family DNA binding protein